MCTMLRSELNTNHVGVKRNSCILSVTYPRPKLNFLARKVCAKAFNFRRFEIQAFLKRKQKPVFLCRIQTKAADIYKEVRQHCNFLFLDLL